MSTRGDLHSIVDGLPESALEDARTYLEALRSAPPDRLAALLQQAPLDDEAFTEADLAAVEASRSRDTSEPPLDWEQVKAQISDG
ncbi:MAG: hypothetical protein GC160_02550 [Acidobacteria bacterium]|nr:hypothetical protein [Acidobacteriota bacterium]